MHPKDPSLTPVEILPVLPDQLLGGWNCVLAAFDGDPGADVERVAGMGARERAWCTAAAQLKSFVRKKAGGVQGRFAGSLMLPARLPAVVDPSDPAGEANLWRSVSMCLDGPL